MVMHLFAVCVCVCTCAPRSFAHTQSSLALLERVCVCVARNEPVLLVGDTGVGKTATVSYLAQLAGMFVFQMLLCLFVSCLFVDLFDVACVCCVMCVCG